MNIPDWKLERLALGELPEPELSQLRTRVAAEPELQRRLQALAESNAEILALHPAETVSRHIRARADMAQPVRKPKTWSLFFLLAPALAAASLLLYMHESTTHQGGVGIVEATRTKGLVPTLLVHRKHGADIELLRDNATTNPGDILQLSYVASGRPFGMVLSIDGRGAVTLHTPGSLRGNTVVERSGEVALPNAYELDDAPRFERFFFVTANHPIDVAYVMTQAGLLAHAGDAAQKDRLQLDGDLEQSSVLLRKLP